MASTYPEVVATSAGQPAGAWLIGYSALQSYIAGHGAIPPSTAVHDGYNIGRWVLWQRAAYKRHSLPPDYITRLEALPGWAWDPHDVYWLESYRTVEAYMAEHQTLPSHTDVGRKLYRWAASQRHAYKLHTLHPWRVALLEALPGWEWDRCDTAWHETYRAVKAYAAKHQTLPDITVVHAGRSLYQWVADQRLAYRRRYIAPERVPLLEALPGWVWSPRDAVWRETYRAIEAHAAKHHALPGPSVVYAGRDLYQWATVQRSKYKKNKLTPERIAALEALPGWAWQIYSNYPAQSIEAPPQPGGSDPLQDMLDEFIVRGSADLDDRAPKRPRP